VKHKWKNLHVSYIKYLEYLKGFIGSVKKIPKFAMNCSFEIFEKYNSTSINGFNRFTYTNETSHENETYRQDADQRSCWWTSNLPISNATTYENIQTERSRRRRGCDTEVVSWKQKERQNLYRPHGPFLLNICTYVQDIFAKNTSLKWN